MELEVLRKRLDRISRQLNVRLDVIQQDYLLSWLLAAMVQEPSLATKLVFKGGTALKKCYFGDYRFSEDLDFSALDDAPTSQDLDRCMFSICRHAETMMREHAPIDLTVERYREKQAHPHGQEAFTFKARFPWQRELLTVVMIEVSREERVLFPPNPKPVIHQYGETLDATVPVYTLEEVILEKLRAILQHTQKLHEKHWTRSRARDYYDLWRIFNSYGDQLSLKDFSQHLCEKCTIKQVEFGGVESFFDPLMITDVRRRWSQWLARLVPNLPACDDVLSDLKPRIADLLSR